METFSLRDTVGNYLVTLAKRDRRVTAVTADAVSTCRLKTFENTFPERLFNVGISEQSMIGFAAGLANEGFIPFTFSMAPFTSMRACEQCRTDIAYGNKKVRMVTAYAGVSGGVSGATHWALEDCGIMCSIPNITVIEPSDPVQAERLMDASLTYSGPIYLRCSVETVPGIYSPETSFEIGKASIAREGDDGAIICSGIAVKYATEASDIFKRETGKCIRVVDMHTIKPIDKEAVIRAAQTGTVIVVQDHNVIGGLGSRVAEGIVSESMPVNFRTLGIPDSFFVMAHAPYLYRKFEIDTEGILKNLREMLP